MFQKPKLIEAPFAPQPSDQHRNNSIKSLKTQEYESKINELSNQIKTLRQRMVQLQKIQKQSIVSKDDPNPNAHHQLAADLITKIKALQLQNSVLRQQNDKLRHKLRQYELMSLKTKRQSLQNTDKQLLQSVNSLKQFKNKQSNKLSSAISNKQQINLIRQLLVQCKQPKEYHKANQIDHHRKLEKDQFYEYKNTEDCFEPFFSALGKEVRIRLKRCLTKQKELLMVDGNVELGTICPYKINHQHPAQYTRMILVLTNIGQQPISSISLQYVHSNDISMTRKHQPSQDTISSKYKTTFPNSISPNEQLKEQLEIIVNSIDFQAVKLNLNYEINQRKTQHILILPLSKIKLFRDMPFTSTPKQVQRIQRVFEYQKKIISDVGKLKSMFGFVYESRERGGSLRYSWKVGFMERVFWVQVGEVEERLSVAVLFEGQRVLAQKILGEYVFLLQRL